MAKATRMASHLSLGRKAIGHADDYRLSQIVAGGAVGIKQVGKNVKGFDGPLTKPQLQLTCR